MKRVFQVVAYDYDESYFGEIFESEEEADKMARFLNQHGSQFFKELYEVEKMKIFENAEEAVGHYRKKYE